MCVFTNLAAMLYLLLALAGVCFLLHVVFLFGSFGTGGRFNRRRYFYSHLTLWITGLLLFILVTTFQGQHAAAMIDYFDTAGRRLMILIGVVALSLLAHIIVRGVLGRD